MRDISITRTSHSRLPEVDFNNIPFGKLFSDHMFIADYYDGQWQDFRIEPFGRITMHPAMLGIHYGQSIFEGMKATKMLDGTPVMSRPELHAKRMNASARRMCMPEFPEDMYVEALHQLLGLDHGWIPAKEDSALYIRPFMYATDEMFGVKPSLTYKFIIFTGPVGPYYPRPVKIKTEQEYVRAPKGGVGEAKAAGNYGAALLPTEKAKEAGFDQVLWLDAKEFRYIQEAGTMNLFFVIDGKVVTPATDGAILKGITRKSMIELLKAKNIPVEERVLDINEIVEAYKAGKLDEAFGAGTAALVAHIDLIQHGDLAMHLPPVKDRKIGPMLKDTINGIRSGRLKDELGWIVPIKVSQEVEIV